MIRRPIKPFRERGAALDCDPATWEAWLDTAVPQRRAGVVPD